MQPIVIIGSGLAGYNVAKEIRKLTDAKIVLITAEYGYYYSKPQLSNALSTKKTVEDLQMLTPDAMREKLALTIKNLAQVIAIKRDEKAVILENNEKIFYSKLILALGAKPNKTAFSASDMSRVFAINDLSSYAAFRKKLQGASVIGILGAGLIGCEFANDLADAGFKVNVISQGVYPLESLLLADLGPVFASELSKKQINWHWNDKIKDLMVKPDKLNILTDNNKTIEVDLLLSAIGISPNIELSQAAGLKTNRGVVVDAYMQTSDPDIFALGDCAEVCGHVVQYIMPINYAARAIAKTIVHEKTKVSYPATIIVVKTSACPLVIAPNTTGQIGRWHISGAGAHLQALCLDKDDNLLGFILMGDRVSERAKLANLLPPLIA